MPRYVVVLGSSHPQGYDYIESALKHIEAKRSFFLTGLSRTYKNASVGTPYNSVFFNRACTITAPLQPHVFYRELAAIEFSLGRIRTYTFSRRTIDIDVLMSLDFTFISETFILPHREAYRRKFFVIPAVEALKSAGWPTPISLLKARAQLGNGYLCPLP